MKKILISTVAAIAVFGLSGKIAPVRAISSIDGTLVTMSSTTIPATLTMQSGATTYTVNVTAATNIVRKYNGSSDLSEFGVADLIRVEGTVTGLTIEATRIKNLSIQMKGAAQWGTILTIDGTNKTFTFESKRRNAGTLTVSTGTSTKVFLGYRHGEFANLKVGMIVKVIGVWRPSQHTLTADRIFTKTTEVEGTVLTVDCTANAQMLTVQTKNGRRNTSTWTVALTATTVLRDKMLNPLACSDIKVDARVHIHGLRTGASSLDALNVMVQSLKKIQKQWQGNISSIDGTNTTFVLDQEKGDDRTITKTAETILVDKTGVAVAFGSLAVGDEVRVWGTLTGSTVVANLIMDKDLPASS